jgi:AcrR family transcriptional regulator
MVFVHFMRSPVQEQDPSRESAMRARILAAAQRRFEAFGFRRSGISDIAREAGVAAGTVYRYFRNKAHLFLEVFRDLNEGWIAQARAAVSAPGTGAERLARLGPASASLYRERSLLNAVLSRDTDRVFAPLLEEMRQGVLERTTALMAAVIRDGIADGSIRAVDPEKAALVLFLAGNALFNEPTRDYQELLPVYVDLVMNGMLPH